MAKEVGDDALEGITASAFFHELSDPRLNLDDALAHPLIMASPMCPSSMNRSAPPPGPPQPARCRNATAA